ncbi:transcription-repair coupling factor [bacterium]|nr:transcription-repair coupling factor [bacterium]
MIFDTITRCWPEEDLNGVLSSFADGQKVKVSGLKASSRAFYLTRLRPELRMTIVVVTPDAARAETLHNDLLFLDRSYFPDKGAPESRILYFPAADSEPYQGVSPHPQISVLRMQALWHLAKGNAEVLVVPLQAALRIMPPIEHFQRCFKRIGKTYAEGPYALAELLRNYGFNEKDLVTSRGEFSLRGAILDVFSPGEESPIRIEFFGNSIESMRSFDTASQRSTGEIEEFTLLSMRELILNRQEIENWGEFCRQRWMDVHYHEELVNWTEQLLQTGRFEGYEDFVAGFFQQKASLFDYLRDEYCLAAEEPLQLEEKQTEFFDLYRKRFDQIHEQRRVALEPQEMFHTWQEIESTQKASHLEFSELLSERSGDDRIFEYSFQSARQYNGQVQEIVQDALRLRESGFTTLYVFPTLGKAERLAEILREYDVPVAFYQNPHEHISEPEQTTDSGKILICIGQLTHGFKNYECQTALFTEDDLFGESRPVIQTRARKAAGKFLSDLRDLKIEDYVVHVDHGIGQFKGLSTMLTENGEKEFLLLRFADDDKLYVPVERLDLVQKYMGASDLTPRLDKLGTMVWQKAKSRAKASMKEMAEKLLQLYAYRKTVKGFRFPPDDSFQREFEDAFEFQETAHQLSAIDDVKADMESDKPMDRLICGDVGYGKTEVGMRAAFKAVTNGKQVAILAPTTILAFQHYHTFRRRFEMFPIRIEMISRFKSRAEIRKILQDMSEGKVDILIGTHRLLSKDVQFHDLGLLIIDEEQRFGVTHKEKIKEMKKNVDALTLTATPIPRTLQMALMGFRPMSIIETPPKDRLAIQTNIAKYSEDTIAPAIRAELKRGGQTYFVHNRVETIHSIVAMVQRLVPEARVAVAHGQIEESALEKVMLQFINHEYDVLVSTTIIENGIDIPLVNTLIVNRADRFGLSQLYQLRGRVGRSHRRAYGYFLIPSEKELTPVARRRLSALREFTELGSGFRLAALDLEIRGAGNLLGSEQHGHIAALGFELYIRMLEQTVKELQGEEVQPEFATEVNLHIDIRIPESYIPNMNQRLNLYKRIATVQSDETLNSIREEMIDRFGPVPEPVENLIEYGRIKSMAEKLKIKSIDRSDGTLFLQFNPDAPFQPETILNLVSKHKGSTFSPAGVLKYPAEKLYIPQFLFPTIRQLFEELTQGKIQPVQLFQE